MKNTSLIVSAVLWLCSCLSMMAAGNKVYVVQSPDKQLKVEISAGTDGLIYSVYHKDSLIVVDSKLGLIQEGKTPALAGGAKVISAKTKKIFQDIDAPFYRFKSFQAVCNEMNLKLKGEYGVYFRVYNEGVAYRFYTSSKEDLIIKNEIAEFRFAGNYTAYLPYSTNKEKPMAMAFQNTYEVKPLSEAPQELAFLPVTVDCKQAKVTLLESDLEAYPGMFVQPDGKQALKGVFAPYPKKTDFYPWRKQEYVTEAENYIARVKGNRMYPWRILAITEKDTEMPVNNLVYALASPNRIGDCSWVKPGKVAWDWWNDWNLKGVSFKAGINMDTYKYYIDFASRNGLEYVVLDEGWYDPKSGDMLTVIPELDLPELIRYGKSKGVELVLWTVFNVLDSQLDEACRKYAEMGIKGFKVDFLDRDDQTAVEMIYRIAAKAAEYKLILDYHGIYKPTGLNRTYPKVVKDQENLHLTLKCSFVDELKIDQSVSHNGVCLTVVSIQDGTYTVTAMKETIERSNIGLLAVGDKVNVERSMMMNGRLDGHIVQGHVDQTAVCTAVDDAQGSWYFTFKYNFDKEMAKRGYFTVDKGSVTVNGVSLTVCNPTSDTFQVAIIPYTYEHTNFHTIKVGSVVNIEFDIIGKYLSRMMQLTE